MSGWFNPPKTFRITYKDTGLSVDLKNVIALRLEGKDAETWVFTCAGEEQDHLFSRRNVDFEITDEKPPVI